MFNFFKKNKDEDKITEMYYKFLFNSNGGGRVSLADERGRELGTCAYFSDKAEMLEIIDELTRGDKDYDAVLTFVRK